MHCCVRMHDGDMYLLPRFLMLYVGHPLWCMRETFLRDLATRLNASQSSGHMLGSSSLWHEVCHVMLSTLNMHGYICFSR